VSRPLNQNSFSFKVSSDLVTLLKLIQMLTSFTRVSFLPLFNEHLVLMSLVFPPLDYHSESILLILLLGHLHVGLIVKSLDTDSLSKGDGLRFEGCQVSGRPAHTFS